MKKKTTPQPSQVERDGQQWESLMLAAYNEPDEALADALWHVLTNAGNNAGQTNRAEAEDSSFWSLALGSIPDCVQTVREDKGIDTASWFKAHGFSI